MGAVNCKSAHNSKPPSALAIKAQKPIKKSQKKFFRSLLRVMISRKRSDNKISPDSSSCLSGEASTSPDPSGPLSPKKLKHVFCPRDIDCSSLIPNLEIEGVSMIPGINSITPEVESSKDNHFMTMLDSASIIPEVDCFADDIDEDISSEEDPSVAALEKLIQARKERFRSYALKGVDIVATLRDQVKVLQQLQMEHRMHLRRLQALKISALKSPQAKEREAKVNASIKKLTKIYRHYERKLYTATKKRAQSSATADHFLFKLNPNLKYIDLYMNHSSFYLRPIPEESQVELELEESQ